MPLRRTTYSLRMLLRYRRQLGRIFRGVQHIGCVWQLDPQRLQAEGVQVLPLDFDGVLAAHGEARPLPEVQIWLTACVQAFGAERVFVLSNKPSLQRQIEFARLFPGVRWISGVRKKPYPDGLQHIVTLTGIEARHIMLMDDRLLTGALATCIVGARAGYVRRPYVNLAQRPITELFFMSLRTAECAAVRLLTGLPSLRSGSRQNNPPLLPGGERPRQGGILRRLGRRLGKKPPPQD